MDRLAACYFCGAALDAPVEEYPLIPRRLEPAPESQRTVTLCEGCREKLGTVVETVLNTVEDGKQGAKAASTDAAPQPGAKATDPAESGLERPDEDAGAPATSTDSATDDEPQLNSTVKASDAARGEADSEDGTGERMDATEPGSQSVSALEYNKVMRLLENRELPLERAAFTTVATSAYEITADEVDTVLDAALSKGLLEEVEGELRRPS
jgi:hypothetical protein